MESKTFKIGKQYISYKHHFMLRFFKRFTFKEMIGLSIALLAWAGDSFFGWQSNIGYYVLGAMVSWCAS